MTSHILSPDLEVDDIFPRIIDELGPYSHMFVGNILNAGAGHRDIRPLVHGTLFNQDIAHGLHNENIQMYSPLHRIPKPDRFFNTIICNAVLEHVSNPDEVMEEFARVCAPGGVLYLSIPFIQPEHRDPGDYQRYTVEGLRLLCERHGFAVCEVGGIHSVHTTLAWIFIEWLGPLRSFRWRLVKAALYPWLRYKVCTSRHHVPSLASAHRAIAVRREESTSPAPGSCSPGQRPDRTRCEKHVAGLLRRPPELL